MAPLAPETWQRLLPAIRARCPRLTEADLDGADRRVDLLAAKIQNRHWIERRAAVALVMDVLSQVRVA